MSFFDSIMVSLFSIALVFFVLISLSVLIIVFSKALGNINKGQTVETAKGLQETEAAKTEPAVGSVPVSAGTLKLIGTDEKTAAMIMAIVSNETNIPLSELSFKSIKCIEES
jgi:hypothetical protein